MILSLMESLTFPLSIAATLEAVMWLLVKRKKKKIKSKGFSDVADQTFRLSL